MLSAVTRLSRIIILYAAIISPCLSAWGSTRYPSWITSGCVGTITGNSISADQSDKFKSQGQSESIRVTEEETKDLGEPFCRTQSGYRVYRLKERNDYRMIISWNSTGQHFVYFQHFSKVVS